MPVYALGDLVRHADAYALVAEATAIPEDRMALGVPAGVRPVDHDRQQKWIDFAVREYRENAKHYRSNLRLIEQGAQG